jgi:ABC-2 type transport system ATP-binding protein
VLTTQVLSEAEELCDDILIIHKGRQVARGDLHTLKLLTAGVYEIALTYSRLPEGIEAVAAALAPLRLRVAQNTVELALKDGEAAVLDAVTRLGRAGHLLRLEVSGASLEDVFLELTKEA